MFCTFLPNIIIKFIQVYFFINIFSMDHRGNEIHTIAHTDRCTLGKTHAHTNENTTTQAHKGLKKKKVCYAIHPLSLLMQHWQKFECSTAICTIFYKLIPTYTRSTQTHMLNNRDASQHTSLSISYINLFSTVMLAILLTEKEHLPMEIFCT